MPYTIINDLSGGRRKIMYGKILKNYLYFIFKYFVTILIGFVATPIILKFIGASEYGVYSLILEYLGYLAISDLGLSTTTNSMLNQAWSENDRNLTVRTIKLLAKEYIKTIPVVLIIIGVTYFALFHISLAKVSTNDHLIAFAIMAVSGFFIPLNIFKDYLICSERSFLVSQMTIIQLFIMTSMNVVLTYLGVGIIGLACSFVGSIIIYHIVVVFFALRKIKEMPEKNIQQEMTIKEIWKVNGHSLAQNLMGRMCYATDTIILSFFSAPNIVTNFILNQKLAKLSDSLVLSIGNSSWATLATFKDDQEGKQKFINLINKVFLLLAYPLLISMASINREFINLWVGNEIYISESFTLVSFSNYLIFGVFSFWGWIFVSEGIVPKLTKTIVISGVVNVIISLVAANAIGPIGPVLGTCASFYLIYLWMIRHSLQKHLQISVNDFVKYFMILTVMFAGIYPLLKYIKFFKLNNWFGLIANLGMIYLVCLSFTAMIVIRKDELNKIIQLLKRRRK